MQEQKPIKILQVLDKLTMDGVNPNSVTILLGNWIQHLEKAPFRLSVCTLTDSDPGGKYLEKFGIRMHYIGLGKYSFRNIAAIERLIEKEQADIVHLHGFRAANFGRLAARRKGVPNIVHEHAVIKMPHQYAADFLLRNYTDSAIAVSQYIKDQMVWLRHIPAKIIRVIGNGVDLNKYRRLDDLSIRSKKAELGIKEGFKVIGTITRLREEKGNEFLIRAVPKILSKFPKSVFLIVGSGPLEKELKDLARDLGVSEAVRFLGFRDDVAELASIFDVNVIASLKEGFSLALVEAMCSGTAIVATRVGGMVEIGRHDDTVVFVAPENAEAIADQVLRILSEPEFAKRLGKSAVQFSKNFSIEANAKALGDFYQKIFEGRGKLKGRNLGA